MSSSNGERWSISAGWVFRGTEYTVCADVRDDVLVIQVEDKITADRWRGQFDAKHIEELTRKTGNFKQFSIFLNMLESAITKSSDSVALDLLTYADLESLRKTKLGSSGSASGRGFTPGRNKTPSPHAKRYLILTYSVEFDRIHYPLALPYCGPPDPAVLQETIRQLRVELEKTKKQAQQGQNHFAFARQQREYDALLQEKEELEEAFESFKQEMMLTQEGAASKEIRILKKVIKNLEEELLKERSKHQKHTTKRNEDFKLLIQELDELRSSERTLRSRVKSLTNELAILKRSIRSSPIPYCTPGTISSGNRTRGTRRTSGVRERQRSMSGDRNKFGSRRHSYSNERRGSQRKLRTPSPATGRLPRFDPTAYVERKKQRQQEVNIRLGRNKLPRSRTNSTENLLRPSKPAGSVERAKPSYRLSSSRCSSRGSSRGSSRRSSVELMSEEENWYDGRSSGVKSGGQKTRRVWGSSPNTAGTSVTPADTKRRSAKKQHDSGLLDHSAEISEIDARLNALQEFMKRSMETAKSSSKR